MQVFIPAEPLFPGKSCTHPEGWRKGPGLLHSLQQREHLYPQLSSWEEFHCPGLLQKVVVNFLPGAARGAAQFL